MKKKSRVGVSEHDTGELKKEKHIHFFLQLTHIYYLVDTGLSLYALFPS